MPPKGGNAKKESGRSKKAENEAKKQEQATAEKVSLNIYLMFYANRRLHHAQSTGTKGS